MLVGSHPLLTVLPNFLKECRSRIIIITKIITNYSNSNAQFDASAIIVDVIIIGMTKSFYNSICHVRRYGIFRVVIGCRLRFFWVISKGLGKVRNLVHKEHEPHDELTGILFSVSDVWKTQAQLLSSYSEIAPHIVSSLFSHYVDTGVLDEPNFEFPATRVMLH